MFFYLGAIHCTICGFAMDYLHIKVYINSIIKNKNDNRLGKYIVDSAIFGGNYGYICKVKNKETDTYFAMKCVLLNKRKIENDYNNDSIVEYNEYNILKLIETNNIGNVTQLIDHFTIEYDSKRDINCYIFNLYDCDLQTFRNRPYIRYLINNTFFHANPLSSGKIRYKQKLIKITKNLKSAVDKTFSNLNTYKAYFKQALFAIQSLHEAGICHRDIKPANVLIREKELALCDFGFAINISENQKLNDTDFGTLLYKAPESFFESIAGYDKKIDIWSIGVVFIELLMNDYLFHGKEFAEIYNNILDFFGQKSSIPNQLNNNSKLKYKIQSCNYNYNVNEELFSVLTKCVEFYPDNRPTAKELLRCDFFNEIN